MPVVITGGLTKRFFHAAWPSSNPKTFVEVSTNNRTLDGQCLFFGDGAVSGSPLVGCKSVNLAKQLQRLSSRVHKQMWRSSGPGPLTLMSLPCLFGWSLQIAMVRCVCWGLLPLRDLETVPSRSVLHNVCAETSGNSPEQCALWEGLHQDATASSMAVHPIVVVVNDQSVSTSHIQTDGEQQTTFTAIRWISQMCVVAASVSPSAKVKPTFVFSIVVSSFCSAS